MRKRTTKVKEILREFMVEFIILFIFIILLITNKSLIFALLVSSILLVIDAFIKMVKLSNTYRMMKKILNASEKYVNDMRNKIRNDEKISDEDIEIINALCDADTIESLDDANNRFWDWGYTRIIKNQKVYNKIKEYIS